MDFPLGEYAEESVQKRAERRKDAGDMPADRQQGNWRERDAPIIFDSCRSPVAPANDKAGEPAFTMQIVSFLQNERKPRAKYAMIWVKEHTL
jgi:hypothetical protein